LSKGQIVDMGLLEALKTLGWSNSKRKVFKQASQTWISIKIHLTFVALTFHVCVNLSLPSLEYDIKTLR
jgi:hypothetical protein